MNNCSDFSESEQLQQKLKLDSSEDPVKVLKTPQSPDVIRSNMLPSYNEFHSLLENILTEMEDANLPEGKEKSQFVTENSPTKEIDWALDEPSSPKPGEGECKLKPKPLLRPAQPCQASGFQTYSEVAAMPPRPKPRPRPSLDVTTEGVDRLAFYSRSPDNPLPGFGEAEYVRDPRKYAGLATIPGWRRKLSNFDVFPFTYEGHMFRTIEHAFQWAKINTVDSAKAHVFCLDSKSQISRGHGAVARSQRRLVNLIDDELYYWNSIKGEVIRNITLAKIQQSAIHQLILRLTKDAQLLHIMSYSNGKTMRFHHLEAVRQELFDAIAEDAAF